MTTTKAGSANTIEIEVLVPMEVPDADRARFEQAMVDFVFGTDRVRPELRDDLAKAGVDFNHLAELSAGQRLGVCPAPGALEIVPSEPLLAASRRHGINLTAGGSVLVYFTYGAYAGKEPPADRLEVNVRLPGGVDADLAGSPELSTDLAHALFGDCELSEPAQAYLRVHGVDLAAIAARNADRLGGPGVPYTSRVSPEIHEYLTGKGFNVDQFGDLVVKGIDPFEGPDPRLSWEKTTCC